MCSEFVNLFMPLGCSMIMYATYFRCSITNAAFFFFHSFFVCRVILRIARSYRIRFDLTVAFVSLRGYSELGEGKLLYIFTSGWLDVFEVRLLEILDAQLLNQMMCFDSLELEFWTIFKLVTQPQRTTHSSLWIGWRNVHEWTHLLSGA